MSELAQLVPLWQQSAWPLFLVFLRVGGMMATLPAFGEQSVPVRVRLGLTLSFVIIVFPMLQIQSSLPPPNLLGALSQGLPEVIAGLFFGLLLRFFVFVLQIAGSIAAQTTSLSQIFGGSAGVDPQPAIGHVLLVSGLALAASMGLHVKFATYMALSYDLVPLGLVIPAEHVASYGTDAVAKTFALGFTLAAPFMIGSLIYNVALGVINKAMPQLMVSFVGAPAITAGGLILLLITAPILLGIWIDAFGSFVMSPGQQLR